jgi:hypothetical protein
MTQTAVDWLIEELQKADWIPKDSLIMDYVVNQANKMHEQQIIDAYNEGGCNWDSELEAEEYYNDTFKEIEKL